MGGKKIKGIDTLRGSPLTVTHVHMESTAVHISQGFREGQLDYGGVWIQASRCLWGCVEYWSFDFEHWMLNWNGKRLVGGIQGVCTCFDLFFTCLQYTTVLDT